MQRKDALVEVLVVVAVGNVVARSRFDDVLRRLSNLHMHTGK